MASAPPLGIDLLAAPHRRFVVALYRPHLDAALGLRMVWDDGSEAAAIAFVQWYMQFRLAQSKGVS